MAWFEGISSSLKGQISNLAKGVLADDSDSDKTEGQREDQESSNTSTSAQDPDVNNFDWNDSSFSNSTQAQDGRSGDQSHTEKHKQGENDANQSILSKKLASFLSLGQGSEAEVQIASLQEENRALRLENEAKNNDIQRYARIIRELESMVADENSNLSTGMEELDIQHQQAIEQVLSVKEETHKQLEALQQAYAELEERNRSLSEEKVGNEEKLQKENAILSAKVEKSNTKSDRETFLVKELEERDKELEELESDNAALRAELEKLKSIQMLQPSEGPVVKVSLPPIPEHNEEIEVLEHKVASLESDVSVLREVRSNLETEVANSRALVEDLNMRLHISEGTNRNQENLQIDLDNMHVIKKELEKELNSSRTHSANLEIELEKLKKEADVLKTTVNEKEIETKTKAKENEDSLLAENSNLKKKIEQIESGAKAMNAQLDSLRQENEAKQNKLVQLTHEMSSVADQLKDATEKETKLKLMVKELELQVETNKDNEKDILGQVDNFNTLKNEVELLTKENIKLQDELKERIATITSLKELLESERENFHQAKKSLENEIESIRNVLSEIQIYKDLQKQREEELKNQLEAKTEEITRIKHHYEENISKLKSQHAAILSETERKLLEKEEKLNELDNKQSEIREIDEIMKQEVERLQAQLTDSNNQNDKLKEEYELKIIELEKSIAENFLEREKKVVETFNSQIALKDQQLNELENKYEESCREIESLKLKIEENANELQAHIADNKELLKRIQIKEIVATGLSGELETLNSNMKTQTESNEKLQAEIEYLKEQKSEIELLLQERDTYIEQIEGTKSKEVTTLKQEVESLKNQLEYATQLMHVAERQEAEGRGNTPPPSQSSCGHECQEIKEELNRVTTSLLKEQTENKLLVNQVTELRESNSKINTQLSRLQSHLVEMEEHYTSVEISSREKIAELEAKQAKVDDWVKTSSTAYTSANIRANQQVESLTQQVRLLTEHKEKLEAELSRAEDNAQKQIAAVTNLQAVLHQFQRDKQRDIDFETERIKQTLQLYTKKNEELGSQIRDLQDHLLETKKGLAAANRLTEQLDQKCEQITALKTEVSDLKKNLETAELKLKKVNSSFEGKVDRNLIKNLLVGYISSCDKFKEQALRVISQVLELNKEERERVGLDTGGNAAFQQSLSEAFIRFLESESQPQVILPLSQPQASVRKISSPAPDVPQLLLDEARSHIPHFSVGRNTGSILKDVLKDRNT